MSEAVTGDHVAWYALVFALNLAIELVVALAIMARTCGYGRTAISCLVGNAVTHPAIHLLLPLVIAPSRWTLFLVAAETMALTVEAVVYLGIAKPRPRILALAAAAGANLASYTAGLLLCM